MKIYILQGITDWEGFTVYGVLSDKSKAEEWVRKRLEMKNASDYSWRFHDSYDVEEIELDSIYDEDNFDGN